MKRLRDVLNQLYGHLDGSVGHQGSHVEVSFSSKFNILYTKFNLFFLQNVDIPGLGFGQSEYYPYVYYKINVDMIETKQL